MNKHLHRLVFSRRLGMRVAVAEQARSCGKPAAGEGGAVALALLAAAGLPLAAAQAQTAAPARPPVVFASKLPAPAAPLPQPYGSTFKADGSRINPTLRPFAYDPAKGSASGDLRDSGRVRWTVNGNTATFDQGSVERVVINWDSFDIGAGHRVHFAQDKDPARYVSALNRIWSADPSLILGSLTADREVILLNANGVYFGRGARVDTGRFVATANAIADSVFERGLRNVTDGSAVMGIEGTDYQPTHLDAFVSVEAGAEIRSAAGGDVLLVAPRVVNQGRIETPRGQTVLAAGDKVYLMSSADPAQRGLIVAVDAIKAAGSTTQADTSLGLAENSAAGSTAGLAQQIDEIRADSGTVNLVGLAVRQAGHINATTAVKGANGAIYLQAMASTQLVNAGAGATRWGLALETGGRARVGAELGTVDIAAGSVTAVKPSTSAATQLDAEVFNPSRIRVEGAAIAVASGARLEAAAGRIELLAAELAQLGPATFDTVPSTLSANADRSRIVVAPGAHISVAGLRDVAVAGERNQASQRLFRIELADAPVQRSGPLYREQVFFDLRDGSKVTAANVSGAAAGIGRTAAERAAVGGSIRIAGEGTVVVGADAQLDVSGGSVKVGPATLQNTLVDQGGRAVLFRSVQAGTAVDGVLAATQATASPGYTEGKDGGALQVNGRVVAVAGQLAGEVVQGERQLAGNAARAASASFSLGNSVLGNFYLGGITLLPGAGDAIDTTIFGNPFGAALDGLPTATALSLAALQQGGFGALSLRAQAITQTRAPDATPTLALGPRGSLALEAHRIALDGEFTAPGGTMTLRTLGASQQGLAGREDISLGAATLLDTAGLWTNLSAGGSAGEVQIDGGRVSLSSAHSVLLDSGAGIDVSAGASLSAAGALARGKAGSITLNAARLDIGPAAELRLEGAPLRGFDFGSGGRLTLGFPGSLVVGGAVAPATVLAPDFFAAGGFGTVAVDAYGDITFSAGTSLAPQLLNWELVPGYRSAPSGRMNASVATPQRVDEQVADRSPVSLAFSATRTLGSAAGQLGGSLSVERGAGITLEPGATLSLSATRNLDIGTRGGSAGQTSTLAAPGGQINLQIVGQRGTAPDPGSAGSGDPVGFLADQALWLGADALLDVAGTAELRRSTSTAFTPGNTGAGSGLTGTVFGGGTITLAAQRGYVVAAGGSRLLLDGAAASLDVGGTAATVARAAGTLRLSTPEGYVLEGSISARAPRDAQGRALADGGAFDLAIGAGGVVTATDSTRLYPGTLVTAAGVPIPGATPKPRQLVVGAESGLLQTRGARFGDDLNAALDNGIGYTPAALLTAPGWASLRLAAGDQVRFDSSLALAVSQHLAFDTPALQARPGVQVALSAATAALGDSVAQVNGRVAADRTTGAATDSTTALRLQARSIDIVGVSALQGWARVEIDAGATGEVRLMGRGSTAELNDPAAQRGSLNFANDLLLSARQVYATSGASFGFNGLAAADAQDAGSLFSVRGPAPAAGALPPLSTFGALSVAATTIDQGGVLHQPFGSITLVAERTLRLGDGSLTSVSGAGLAQIYGSTDNLTRWLLPSGLFGTELPRAKGVSLSAGHFDTAAGANVSAAGGGDIQAWEFFQGVGGSTDTFLAEGQYAVLPDYNGTQALALGGGRLGDTQQHRELVVTMAGSGLAPGRYTLLPARYALMAGALPQGAFLVRRAADQGKTQLTAPIVQDDGGVVITGLLTRSGAIASGTPGERFIVETPATFNARSEVRLTSVGGLIGSQTGAINPLGQPADAGQVQLAMTGSTGSLWQAALALGAAGGSAGRLDFTASQVALVDDAAKAPADAFTISSSVLADSRAGSLLLGGLRTPVAAAAPGLPAWRIDGSLADAVAVDLGTQTLAVEELVLTARSQVSLAAGTRLAASGAATQGARTLVARGDGALAIVSANALDVERTGATLAGGDLAVGADSVLQGAQLSLEATGVLAADRSAQLDATRLNLAARRVIVGEGAPGDAQATVLAGELLDTARAAPALTLRSFSSIDFVGEQDWARRATPGDASSPATVVGQRLVLDSPVLRGLPGAAGEAARTDIAAQDIVLRNTSGAATVDAGSGLLLLQALPPLRYGQTGGLTLGPGTVNLAYADATLRSGGDIVLQGSGSTRAQGDLTLAAARVTATTGADQSLAADAGTLAVLAQAGSRSLGERVGQGARLNLQARTLRQDGTIDLPGGALILAASGSAPEAISLSFGIGSITSVAGFALPAIEGFEAHGTAGSLLASAAQGGIRVAGRLDVSAAASATGTAGDAGRIELRATGDGGVLQLAGELRGQSGRGGSDRGGSLVVDVTTLPDADALAQAARDGGLDREWSLRVRRGDVTLGSDVQAARINLSADGGRLGIDDALLDARAASGGVVQLQAGGDLLLGAGSRIDARSSRSGANGGDVLLGSAGGRISVSGDAQVDAGGDDALDGRIVLRAARGSDNASVAIDALNTANLLAAQVDIEAVRVYQTVGTGAAARGITSIAATTNAATGALGQATVRADSTALRNAAPGLLAGLGVGAEEVGRVALRAGVEVRAAGDLSVSAAWLNKDPDNAVLANRRVNEDAGYLTLRAAGNLNINAALSDGFTTATATGVLLQNSPRDGSLRLVAGADLGSANPLAARELGAGSTETGNLTIAGNQFVRTGAGSIDLVAGRSIIFGTGTPAAGQAYVAGRRLTGGNDVLTDLFAAQGNASTGLGKPVLTEQGGRLTLQAGRDITAPEATQLVNNWFWRSGLPSTLAGEEGLYNPGSQVAWWSEFTRLRQTLGSFGGGGLSASAGRDLVNVQAMVPTQGWADSREATTAGLEVRNGGDLDLRAGRNVLGGQYFVGRGEGRITAAGAIGSASANTRVQEPVLALIDGTWRLAARESLTTTGAFNPTALPAPTADARQGAAGFFYTWGEGAGLDLSANAGALTLAALGGSRAEAYGLVNGVGAYAAVQPASLRATAAGGNLSLTTSAAAVLFPATRSELRLWSGGDLVQGQLLAMADSELALWPSYRSPVPFTAASTRILNGLVTPTLADTLPHAGLRVGDTEPVRVHAAGSYRNGRLNLAKSALIDAGFDMLDLLLTGQNLDTDDLTRVSAGRDFIASLPNVGITLAGPGALEVTAGRDVDLGASGGITTIGNQRNPGLTTAGAAVRLTAAADGRLDLAAFEAAYLSDPEAGAGGSVRAPLYRDALLASVRLSLQQPDLDYEQALAQFRTFPAEAQAAFGRQVLAAEFGATYLSGTPPSAAQMTESLRAAFERQKAQVLQAGDAALAAGGGLTLPGRDVLSGPELAAYLGELRTLNFSSLNLDSTVAARAASLEQVHSGWREAVARSLGGTAANFDALAATNPQDGRVLAWRNALGDFSGRRFEAYRQQVLASETAATGAVASLFGRRSLPMRLALFEQGFQAAELAGAGSFVAQPIWPGRAPVFGYTGTMALTQSAVVTERGGDIALVNAGGAINVGLKESNSARSKGVITLGGGSVFGYARDDFQVNTQRVFIVGQGDMNIWSSSGDIDSGRGANTAVAAPPLAARRSVDGIVFEVPATTTGSGLGILEDILGRRSGTIGLYPAFGEILALDAFIRAPSVVLGSTIRGADNLQSASVGGAAAVVAAPAANVAPPPASNDNQTGATGAAPQAQESRPRNALLTVELLGLGAAPETDNCSDEDEKAGKCRKRNKR